MKPFQLFLFALITLPAFAQNPNFKPFIEAGKIWRVQHLDPKTGRQIDMREYFFGKDTIILGTTCANLMCRTIMDGQEDTVCHVAPLFEKENVVYFFRYDELQGEFLSTPVILYDFSANAGSEVKLGLPNQDYALGFDISGKVSPLIEKCVFRAVIPLKVHGHDVQCYCFWDRWTYETERYNFYMEGIGTEFAPIFNVLTSCPIQEFKLLECRVGDDILYTAEDNPRQMIEEYALKQEQPSSCEYIPFVEKDKQWVSTLILQRFGTEPIYRWTYYFDDDTIVNNIPCVKFMCYEEDLFNKSGTNVMLFSAYENNRRVYFFPNGEAEAQLWYDFDSTSGTFIQQKRILNTRHPTLREGIDSLLVWGDAYVQRDGYSFRMKIGSFWDEWQKGGGYRVHGPNVKWVEGLGSFVSPVDFDIDNIYEESPVLQECRVGNRILYRRAGYQPTGMRFPFTFPTTLNSHSSFNCTDLSGRRLSTPPTRPGLYIKDGRKVLIK